MADQVQPPVEPDGAPAAAPDTGAEAPPAEPRSIRPGDARSLIFKHANDRRTLDRVVSRMRAR